MQLAKDEKVIKEWEYAVARKKGIAAALFGDRTRSSLIVTDKRIVSDIESSRGINREEIPLNSVKGIKAHANLPSKLLGIILLIAGLLLAVIGVVLIIVAGETSFIAGIVMIVVGLVVIILAIPMIKKSSQFTLVLLSKELDGLGSPLLALSVNTFTGTRRRRAKAVKIKMSVDKEVIRDIIDSLGAVILTYQDSKNN